MALSTYEELKKSVIEYSHREDADLLIDDFILMTESEFYNNDEEILLLSSSEQSTTIAVTGQTFPLPDGFIKMRGIRVNQNGELIKLQFATPESIRYRSSTGSPSFFTVIGDEVKFDINPDSNFDIIIDYTGEILPLSTSNPTNAVLTKHPQAYLFGCLYFLKLWADEPQDAQLFYVQFLKVIRGANKRYKKGRYGTGLAMRIDGATP
tara:strand:+ start:2318 stop:2941 length:624 start_codon:yes stop_codon:yes gene_type:complete